ncbi:MAG: hypothetical protein KatS3mg016_1392 [Fimbriimonadales bacterium]|nr:MAG: hypothetical protein KatS3mg016_1392 [Fimbriimonadales bacterium]GIV07711.1 MAG: hypothetical protein KatS3mg017_0913 [Fimbriimonadales bacterium]
MRTKGFTLKEFLVAILIMILIIGLLYPAFLITRSRVSEAKCRANLLALWTWYNTKQALGEKVNNTNIRLFLFLHPDGQKMRCPLSGKAYSTLPADGQPFVEGPDYILRKNPHILAYCPWHIHPSAKVTGYNPDGTPIVMGTGSDRWDNPVYLAVYKNGQVKYVDVYQVERRTPSTQR